MLYYKTFIHQSPDSEWVVLVHGVGGSSSIWFKQLRDYRKHFHILLVDLRGHGKSQTFLDGYIPNKYSFEEISRDVLEVLDHLKIEQAHFIGISMGTIVIRTLGEIAPQRMKSMIMGGAVTRLNTRSKFLMWVADTVKKYIPFIWLYAFYAYILMPRERNKESRMLFIREAKHIARKEIMRWFTLTAQVNPLLKYFSERELLIPTLYVMGDEDYMFLPQVQRLVAQHKNSLLEVLKTCGHVVNVEKPEIFNEISVRFMQNPAKYQLSQNL